MTLWLRLPRPCDPPGDTTLEAPLPKRCGAVSCCHLVSGQVQEESDEVSKDLEAETTEMCTKPTLKGAFSRAHNPRPTVTFPRPAAPEAQ